MSGESRLPMSESENRRYHAWSQRVVCMCLVRLLPVIVGVGRWWLLPFLAPELCAVALILETKIAVRAIVWVYFLFISFYQRLFTVYLLLYSLFPFPHTQESSHVQPNLYNAAYEGWA